MTLSAVQSQDGKTILQINSSAGKIVDMDTGEELRSINFRGVPELAAISNNRKLIAIALRSILTDVYIFKDQNGQWSMTLLSRGTELPEALRWDESDDSRYPPQALCVQTKTGDVSFLPDGTP